MSTAHVLFAHPDISKLLLGFLESADFGRLAMTCTAGRRFVDNEELWKELVLRQDLLLIAGRKCGMPQVSWRFIAKRVHCWNHNVCARCLAKTYGDRSDVDPFDESVVPLCVFFGQGNGSKQPHDEHCAPSAALPRGGEATTSAPGGSHAQAKAAQPSPRPDIAPPAKHARATAEDGESTKRSLSSAFQDISL